MEKTWIERKQEQQTVLKEKLAKQFEVEDNPKLDECFRLAWEYGHSNGLYEVEIFFSDLVSLIK